MSIFTRLFRAKSKVTIYYDRNGEVIEAVGNIGRTRACRGAFKLHKGQIEPTTGYKLRRFIRRLAREIAHRAEMASRYCDEESVRAIPVIGLLEGGR